MLDPIPILTAIACIATSLFLLALSAAITFYAARNRATERANDWRRKYVGLRRADRVPRVAKVTSPATGEAGRVMEFLCRSHFRTGESR